MLIRLGHSPDPDDAFMFWALAAGAIDTRGFEFEHVLQDIQTLSEWALEGRLETTAMSLASYPLVQDKYAILPHGASMGSGYGPVVVGPRALSRDELLDTEIVVPGEMTTAFLTLRLCLGEFRYRVLPFDQILDEVLEGRADAGLLIHEGQLTYASLGLEKSIDLGEWWLLETGLPLPLGINVARRDLGEETAARPVGGAARVDPRRARQPRGGDAVRDAVRARSRRGAHRPFRRHVRERADRGLRRRGTQGRVRAARPRRGDRLLRTTGRAQLHRVAMPRAVVLSAVRTPVGRYGGSLSGVRPDDLAATAIAAAVERAGVRGDEIEDVYFGCANQAGEDNRNVARMAVLLAGLPESVAGVTVNRLCASGLAAVVSACHAVIAGDGDLFVAGGVESMSRAPLAMAKPDTPFPRGNQTAWDTTLGWRFPNPRLEAMFPLESMGETGENVAERWGVSREDQDAFALESQQRWAAADAGGPLRDELVPVGDVERDEHPRPETSAEKLAALKPAFRAGGTRDGGQLVGHQRRRRGARDRIGGEGAGARRRAARRVRRQRGRRRRSASDGHRPGACSAQAARARRASTSASSTSSS